ncbi:MAG: NADP(H)-dependent aldo-keto reductase [Oligoflexia bacterium]|nr:NADP(H)-dependent aldo-keto reductase [Oligoflexia bacterium]
MKYNKLGNTDIDVSVICLGTMTWGEQNSQAEAHEQLDYSLDQGVNFIDTAEMYPVPPNEGTYSKTEQIIGNWDKMKTSRDKFVLATKIVGPMQAGYIRGGDYKFNKKNIRSAFEASLKRLKTDYIDLYQLHWPERPTNYFGQRGFGAAGNEEFTDVKETLEALNELVKEGKLRHIGLSNETPWGIMKFLEASRKYDLPKVQSIQNPYSLLNRLYEVGAAEVSLREDAGLLAYSPLGFGVLTGKYLNGARPEGARLTKWDYFSRYNKPNGVKATEMYCQLANDVGLTPTQLALAFVNTRPFVTSNIIGATKMSQLKENIESANVEISSELLEKINEINELIPNPAP